MAVGQSVRASPAMLATCAMLPDVQQKHREASLTPRGHRGATDAWIGNSEFNVLVPATQIKGAINSCRLRQVTLPETSKSQYSWIARETVDSDHALTAQPRLLDDSCRHRQCM